MIFPNGCTCGAYLSVLPPPPCPVHSQPQCCGFGCNCPYIVPRWATEADGPFPRAHVYEPDDTQPIPVITDDMVYPPEVPQ